MTISRYLNRLFRRPESEEGVILVIFAIMLTMICLFAGLAIDLGSVSQTHQNAQGSSDSAALAGASLLDYVQTGVLTEPEVVAQVENYVISNYTTYSGLTNTSTVWDNCTASTPSGWPTTTQPAYISGKNYAQNCILFNSSSFPNIIQVALPPETVNYVLAKKGQSQTVSAVSTAAIPASSPCALCILNKSGSSLTASVPIGGICIGTNPIDILFLIGCTTSGAAGIDVNSSSNCAANLSGGFFGTVAVYAPSFNVVGTECGSSSPATRTPLTAPISDPLSNLPVPNTSTYCTSSNEHTATFNVPTGSATLTPGCYGNINADTAFSGLTLQAGLYVITGHFDYNNALGAIISPSGGVTLYFTCGTASAPTPCAQGGQAGGYFTEDSTADLLDITPTSASTCSTYTYPDCAYVNLTFFYDRNDDSPLTLDSSLGGDFFGTIYAADSTYSTQGFGNVTQDSLVVVGALNYQAIVGLLDIYYQTGQNVPTGQAELCNNSSTGNNC